MDLSELFHARLLLHNFLFSYRHRSDPNDQFHYAVDQFFFIKYLICFTAEVFTFSDRLVANLNSN